MESIALGLDLGTSGVRVVAVNSQGKLVSQATQSYPLLTPKAGWTEQDPADWIRASFAALQELTQTLQGRQIVALGLSGQMHGMVAIDAEGSVIRPAILWNDQRTGEAVAEIEVKIPRAELIQRTGNRAVTGFQLPKLLWLRSNEPQAFEQTQRILLPKDYLSYVFTGVQATEPSDASGVGCLNLSDRHWDTKILSELKLSPTLFPSIARSTEIIGSLKPEIASLTGLPAQLPIIAGGGDNASAAIGLGILSSQRSLGSVSLGTSGVILAPVEQPTPDPEGRVHLFCHVDGGYHLLGVTLSAAGSLRWYRDTVAPELSYEQLMEAVPLSPAGADGLLFLPHLSGERSPYLDPDARGAWIGLSLAHPRSHMTRSVLEGVALSLKAAFEVMKPLSSVEQFLATGGGAKSPIWLQILADVLQIKLLHPASEEGAAFGAALLALVGVGVYRDLEAAVRSLSQEKEIVSPQPQPVYQGMFDRYQALYQALKQIQGKQIP